MQSAIEAQEILHKKHFWIFQPWSQSDYARLQTDCEA